MFAFVFSRKKFNRILVLFVCLWVLVFTLRVILYTVLGPEVFFLSSANRILSSFSGVFAGISMCMMVVKRKSAKIPKAGQAGSHVK